tara:strand:- start:49 stop:270 length:222 start_codon:yes stop_codon:yes gene_type:complete
MGGARDQKVYLLIGLGMGNVLSISASQYWLSFTRKHFQVRERINSKSIGGRKGDKDILKAVIEILTKTKNIER